MKADVKYNRKYLRELYKDDKSEYLYDDRRYGQDGEIEEYGFSMLETWNLDMAMVEVLYERLKRYLTQDMVNLEFHTQWGDERFNGKNQLELINILIDKCEKYLLMDSFNEENYPLMKEIWELWIVIAPAMWW